jgi:hypothetical protein
LSIFDSFLWFLQEKLKYKQFGNSYQKHSYQLSVKEAQRTETLITLMALITIHHKTHEEHKEKMLATEFTEGTEIFCFKAVRNAPVKNQNNPFDKQACVWVVF